MNRDGYTARMKRASTGNSESRFVWLCNFEVENQWAHAYVGLPSPKLSVTDGLVQRMEQMGALLAEPSDHVLLGRGLDKGFRDYGESLGLSLPQELVPDPGVDSGDTSEAVLNSPDLLERLSGIAQQGAYLMPMGNSVQEQKVADVTGLRLAVPPADVCERVNSKIYSRRLVDELGLRTIPGHCCETTGDLRAALEEHVEQKVLVLLGLELP